MSAFEPRSLILCALLGGLLLASGEADADEITGEDCLACHGIEGFANPETGQPIFIDAPAMQASVHGSFPCTACHRDVTALPHPEKLRSPGLEVCSGCHADAVISYQKGIHGQARAQGAAEAATCTSCHGPPHSLRKSTDPASPVYPLNLPRACGACHGDPEMAKRYGIPVANAYQLFMDSIHGRALTRSGLLVAANCSSCHGTHEIRPSDDPTSRVYRRNVPSTCGTCHAGVAETYAGSIHGQAAGAGRSQAPVCIDCHTAHEIARVTKTSWKLDIIRECGTCHEESLRTYRDTFHGQVTALGFTRVARCSDCHGSHGIRPASDPESTIAPGNIVTTCKKCHPDANANFVRFSPHADPTNPRGIPSLYYTAWFMHFLIIGVFAFFGFHSFLWFLRSALSRTPRRTRKEDEPDA